MELKSLMLLKGEAIKAQWGKKNEANLERLSVSLVFDKVFWFTLTRTEMQLATIPFLELSL